MAILPVYYVYSLPQRLLCVVSSLWLPSLRQAFTHQVVWSTSHLPVLNSSTDWFLYGFMSSSVYLVSPIMFVLLFTPVCSAPHCPLLPVPHPATRLLLYLLTSLGLRYCHLLTFTSTISVVSTPSGNPHVLSSVISLLSSHSCSTYWYSSPLHPTVTHHGLDSLPVGASIFHSIPALLYVTVYSSLPVSSILSISSAQ